MPDAQRAEIAKLEALHAEHPQGRIFTHLAEAYRKAGEYERAQEVLAEGIGRHPDYSSAHVVLARVLMDMGEEERAVAEFQRVLELDSHNLVALRCLGDLARAAGHVDEAGRYYRRLLDVEPSDDDVRAILGRMESPPPAEEAQDAEEPWVTGGEADEAAPFPESTWDGSAAAAPGLEGTELEGTELEGTELEGTGLEAPDVDASEGLEIGPPEPGPVEPGVMTETIAQVYARQGLYDRAAEVYRSLVEARPDDPGLRTRLEEMEALAAAPSPGTRDVEATGPALEDGEPALATGGGGEPAPEAASDVDAPALEGLETMEMDAAPDVAPLPGLESDELDAETGLRPVDEPPAIEGVPDEGVSDVPPPPEEESPWASPEPVADLPDGDEPWASSAPGPAGEEAGAAAVEDADEPWVPGGEPEEAEPWGTGPGPEPEAEETEAERVESVWTGAEGASTPEESPYSWADGEGEAPADDSEAIGSYLRSLLGWAGGGAGGAGGGGATGPAPSSPEGAEGGVEADEAEPAAPPAEPRKGPSDDDDLDTFRSWLESLKQ